MGTYLGLQRLYLYTHKYVIHARTAHPIKERKRYYCLWFIYPNAPEDHNGNLE